jgi:hypothetical protein
MIQRVTFYTEEETLAILEAECHQRSPWVPFSPTSPGTREPPRRSESGGLSGVWSPVGDIRPPIAAITWAFSAQHGSRAAKPASISERTLDACEH